MIRERHFRARPMLPIVLSPRLAGEDGCSRTDFRVARRTLVLREYYMREDGDFTYASPTVGARTRKPAPDFGRRSRRLRDVSRYLVHAGSSLAMARLHQSRPEGPKCGPCARMAPEHVGMEGP